MTTSLQALFLRTQSQIVLGDLLPSLSQPLTTLRCSLELSIEEVASGQQGAVATALEQTDRVIGMVRLMREYLDAESASPVQQPVALGEALRSVVNQLSAVGQVHLHVTGTDETTIAIVEPRLRFALQYLIGILIEERPSNCGVTLRLEQGPSESMLRAEAARNTSTAAPAMCNPLTSNLREVKLAIARRVLESAGASLTFNSDDRSGFVLRVRRQPGPFAPDLSA